MGSAQAGPIDVIFLRFTGNRFNSGIAPALRDLTHELEPSFVDIDGQFEGGLLDAEDVEDVSASLEPNTSVAVVAVENLWAIPFIDAVRRAGGELIDQVRVPSAVVMAVRDAAQDA